MSPQVASALVLAPPSLKTAAGSKSGLPEQVVPGSWGVNVHFREPLPEEWPLFQRLAPGWVRRDLLWHEVETKAGVYDFAPYDAFLARMEAQGVRVLFLLGYGNPLYERSAPPRTPAVRRAFCRFAEAAAKRYRGRGVLFDLWNEPDQNPYWQPPPSGEEFVRFAAEVKAALRRGDPNAFLLAPGVTNFTYSPFFVSALQSGLLNHVDALDVHPYRGGLPEQVVLEYDQLRVLLARYAPRGRTDVPIVSSEWGYSVGAAYTPQEQARFLLRSYLMNLSQGVNLSIWYVWHDMPEPARPQEGFGIIQWLPGNQIGPKPSYEAIQKFLREMRGYTFRHRLSPSTSPPVSNRGNGAFPPNWQLLFSRGEEEVALVSWTTDERASEQERTPRIDKVPRTDHGRWRALRRLASISYDTHRVLGQAVTVSVHNPESRPARIGIAIGSQTRTLTVPAGGSCRERIALPLANSLPRSQVDVRLPVRIAWNDEPLPDPTPVRVFRTDALSVTVVPWGESRLLVRVETDGPGSIPFAGSIRLVAPKEMGTTAPLSRNSGEAILSLPTGGRYRRLDVLDAKGRQVFDVRPPQFQTAPGFPTGADALPGVAVAFDGEAGGGSASLRVLLPRGEEEQTMGGPGGALLSLAYQFGKTPRPLLLHPAHRLVVPEEAEALLLPVWSDGAGDIDHLRCLLVDATGQTFSVGLLHARSLSTRGWHVYRVPLRDLRSFSYGGASDGIPRLPLRVSALLHIEAREPGKTQPRELRLGQPWFVLPEP